MTYYPQIPPTAPVSMTQKPSPAAPAGPVVATKAVVREAPDSLRKPEKHTRTEGRVTSHNPQTKELRIATKEGDITVESEAAIPADTEVSVELYMQKTETLANIAILKKQDETARELAKAVAAKAAEPPPELKAGDKLIALQLQEDSAPEPAVKMTLEQAAKIIEQMRQEGLQNAPAKIPLPAEVLIALAKSKDVLATLQKLPQEQQQAVLSYLQKQVPAASTAPVQEPIDENLLGIAQAQASSRIAHEVLNTSKTASEPVIGDKLLQSPALALLSKIIPFIENLESATEPVPAYMRQFVTPQAMAHIQEADPTLHKNFFQFTVQRILPPGTPDAQIPVMPAATQAQPSPPRLGMVDALTPSGYPIIKTQTGGITEHFVLKPAASVPLGSMVVFDVQPMTTEQVLAQTAPAATTAAPSAMPALGASVFDPLKSNAWPALQEAMQAISQSSVAASTGAALKNTMPSPTPKFTPSALFFFAALRSGAVESWLGANTLQALKDSGKRDIAEKLESDFGRISSQSKEILNGEWRMISMPMLHDEHLSQMQFFIRRQHDKEEGKEGDASPYTRFILNLNLSRMGDMQIDGLMRQKKFDVILRSQEALTPSMRQELAQAFAKGLEQANMQGGISFQVKREHWVTVDLPLHQATLA